MTEMTDGEQVNTQSSAILKELSDIKATLAVNTNETVNIKAALAEMKLDIKEIKNDFVNRREHNELLKVVAEHGKKLETVEYFTAKIVGMAAGASLVVYYLLQFINR